MMITTITTTTTEDHDGYNYNDDDKLKALKSGKLTKFIVGIFVKLALFLLLQAVGLSIQ